MKFEASQIANKRVNIRNEQIAKRKVSFIQQNSYLFIFETNSPTLCSTLIKRKEIETKLKIANKFIEKFQLKSEELNRLCPKKDSALHPVLKSYLIHT